MAKVFVVTTGGYSDYSITGVFTSSERAERYMATCSGDVEREFNPLEEYELDDGIAEIDRGLKLFGVEMNKRGDVIKVMLGGYPSIVTAQVSWMKISWDGGRRIDLPTDEHTARMWVWADDQQHAIKVANERRILSLASPDS